MCCSVDAAGKTGDHDEPPEPELRGEVARQASAVRRGVACADHGDHWLLQQLGLAEDGQDWRGVLDRGEGTRVTRLAPADEPRPGAVQCAELGLGLGPGDRGYGRGAFAAASETRQHVECGSRRTETAQHRMKADRADRLGAAQPQPVETLLRIEFACSQGLPQPLVSDIRLSVPAIRRRMLAWWRRMINRAIPAITAAAAPSATKEAIAAAVTAPTRAASEE